MPVPIARARLMVIADTEKASAHYPLNAHLVGGKLSPTFSRIAHALQGPARLVTLTRLVSV